MIIHCLSLHLFCDYIVSMASSVTPKLRIKLRSYDVKMLEASIGKVVSLLSKS